VLFDGVVLGENKPMIPFKFSAEKGEHYIQIQGNHQGKLLDKGDVVNVEPDKQKILKFTFDEITEIESTMEAISVADLNVPMPGTLTQMTWTSKNTGSYPFPTYYYAFEKGDKVIVDLTMSNLKGTNSLTIRTHPNNVSVYSNNYLTELNQLELTISERTILKFTLYSNHAIDRNGFLKIKRIPASPQTAKFNTSVSKKPYYNVSKIIEAQQFYVNSTTNSGGKNRVSIPLTLPEGTVEWYYRFSAYRDSALIQSQQKSNNNLFSEVASFFLGGAAPVLGAIGNMLMQPPGADFCDVYMLSPENRQLFMNESAFKYILDGSRQNLKSGNIRVTCCNKGTYHLGLKNPDNKHGVHVNIEAVAITMYEDYTMDHKD
jgi:hypothetical protein